MEKIRARQSGTRPGDVAYSAFDVDGLSKIQDRLRNWKKRVLTSYRPARFSRASAFPFLALSAALSAILLETLPAPFWQQIWPPCSQTPVCIEQLSEKMKMSECSPDSFIPNSWHLVRRHARHIVPTAAETEVSLMRDREGNCLWRGGTCWSCYDRRT